MSWEPREIINNFPDCVRKAYFIWMFKIEKELLSRKKKKKWRKAVKAKGAVCITKLQNYTGSWNVYRVGRVPLEKMRHEGYGER